MMKIFFSLLVLLLAFPIGRASALTIHEYLDQVTSRQKSLRGSKISASAALKRAREASLMVLPTLIGDASYFEDDFAKSPFPLGTKSQYSTKIGIREQTPFGLDIEVSSIFQKQDLVGYTGTPYSYSQNQLVLVASLWRNILGAETRGHRDLVQSKAMAEHYHETFQVKSTLANAEIAYWNLVLARSSVEFQKNSVKRSERIYNWNRRKSTVDLVNESSLAQAAANLALRKTTLESAKSLEREMRYIFNTLRAQPGEDVEDLSEALAMADIVQPSIPEKLNLRDDYRAQSYSLDSKMAEARLFREENSPDIKFHSSLMSAGQANDDHSKSAIADSFQMKDTGYSLGISLVLPLSLLDLSRARSGWSDEIVATQLKKDSVVFQNKQEFENLRHSLEEAVSILKLRLDVEASQKRRLESDQKLFDRGRTTTFQLIQAEEDYSSSQLSRLDSQAKALTLYAKLKLFL